jgi:hypothetical protein
VGNPDLGGFARSMLHERNLQEVLSLATGEKSVSNVLNLATGGKPVSNVLGLATGGKHMSSRFDYIYDAYELLALDYN